MIMEFADREQFILWIAHNVEIYEGIWIRFIKAPKGSLTAEEALDIALCYGWIDGQMKTEGESSYLKYFSKRTENSKWSEKNKKSIERLRKNKLMTKYGEEAVKKAMKNGRWEKKKETLDFEKLITEFSIILIQDKNILNRFNNCTLSEKKRICGFYFDAKTVATREKRLNTIKKALEGNYKGMLY
jgi:uncharacterized protein YdeI (YjbR/CyaY-like superfamily)